MGMVNTQLILGDCLEVMQDMEPNSIHSIVTDPPYGLSFMGKDWDHGVPGVAFWEAALRVAKPGAILLAFGGDRTHHRLMVAIEDAGWEIRTCLYWITGQGFPKSLNVGKAIRKQFSADVLCACDRHSTQTVRDSQGDCPEYLHSHDGQLHVGQDSGLDVSRQPTDAHARTRDGRNGDALASAQANTSPGAENGHLSNGDCSHPSSHPSLSFQEYESALSDMALNKSHVLRTENGKTDSRKSDKLHSERDSASSSLSSPENVTHSNIPYCTTCGKPIASAWDGFGSGLKPAAEIIVMAMKPLDGTFANNALVHGVAGINIDGCRIEGAPPSVPQPAFNSPTGKIYGFKAGEGRNGDMSHANGRWPANLLLDEEAAAMLDEMSGVSTSTGGQSSKPKGFGSFGGGTRETWKQDPGFGDTGGASRFFYCAKASKRDRDEGLEGMEERDASVGDRRPSGSMSQRIHADEGRPDTKARNHHPCVKPTTLMRYLVRLVTPPGGTVLDPFCGSGSTGKAAALEGFNFVGIDTEAEYLGIAERRTAHAQAQAEKQTQAQPLLLEVACPRH